MTHVVGQPPQSGPRHICVLHSVMARNLAPVVAAIRDEAKAEALAPIRAEVRRLILRLEPHAKNMQALGEIEISVPLLACVDGLRALLGGGDQ